MDGSTRCLLGLPIVGCFVHTETTAKIRVSLSLMLSFAIFYLPLFIYLFLFSECSLLYAYNSELQPGRDIFSLVRSQGTEGTGVLYPRGNHHCRPT